MLESDESVDDDTGVAVVAEGAEEVVVTDDIVRKQVVGRRERGESS